MKITIPLGRVFRYHSDRLIRGGFWIYGSYDLQLLTRGTTLPTDPLKSTGFRIVKKS